MQEEAGSDMPEEQDADIGATEAVDETGPEPDFAESAPEPEPETAQQPEPEPVAEEPAFAVADEIYDDVEEPKKRWPLS